MKYYNKKKKKKKKNKKEHEPIKHKHKMYLTFGIKIRKKEYWEFLY